MLLVIWDFLVVGLEGVMGSLTLDFLNKKHTKLTEVAKVALSAQN